MDVASTIALSLGAAWGSGVNLYATVLTLGLLHLTGRIELPETLQVVSHPAVLGVAAFMFVVEFVADKIPVLDSAWDAVHTFIRIPAGAVLAAGAVGAVDPLIVTLAMLVGGATSTASHGAKMTSRLAINTSPEPFSNWLASIVEDIVVVGGIVLAIVVPGGVSGAAADLCGAGDLADAQGSAGVSGDVWQGAAGVCLSLLKSE